MNEHHELSPKIDNAAAPGNGQTGEDTVKEALSQYPYKTGRRPKTEKEKYKPISIRLHPLVIEWAKEEAKRRGVGYQSVINETLLELIVS